MTISIGIYRRNVAKIILVPYLLSSISRLSTYKTYVVLSNRSIWFMCTSKPLPFTDIRFQSHSLRIVIVSNGIVHEVIVHFGTMR